MFDTVVFQVDQNGHAAAGNREAQRWITRTGTSCCARLVAARDVDGRPICSTNCARHLATGERPSRPPHHAVVRGQLCRLSCTRHEDVGIVSVERLHRRACRPSYLLSARERQMLSLVAQGATAKEVASTMGLHEESVRVHLDHIGRRLRLRAEDAAKYRAKQELLDREEQAEGDAPFFRPAGERPVP